MKPHISQLTTSKRMKCTKRENERAHSSSNISRFWTASMEASASATVESTFAMTAVELAKGLDEETNERTSLDEEEEEDGKGVADMQ